jgi:hypothetical protein
MSYVKNKGYWEERKSVREGKKVRSVFVRYIGKVLGPAADISLSASIMGDPDDRAMAVADRLGEKADRERGPVVEESSELPSGLHVGPTDPTEAVDKSKAEDTAAASDAPDASSEPDAPSGSDDASGSSSESEGI